MPQQNNVDLQYIKSFFVVALCLNLELPKLQTKLKSYGLLAYIYVIMRKKRRVQVLPLFTICQVLLVQATNSILYRVLRHSLKMGHHRFN